MYYPTSMAVSTNNPIISSTNRSRNFSNYKKFQLTEGYSVSLSESSTTSSHGSAVDSRVLDSLKCWNTTWPNHSKFNNSIIDSNQIGRSMDACASSKAILIGDFLTAKQLDRASSLSWNASTTSVITNSTGKVFY